MCLCIHTLNTHRVKASPLLNCMGTGERSQVQEVWALSNLFSTGPHFLWPQHASQSPACSAKNILNVLLSFDPTAWPRKLPGVRVHFLVLPLQGELDCAKEESTPSHHLHTCQGLTATTKYLRPHRGDSWLFWAVLSCSHPHYPDPKQLLQPRLFNGTVHADEFPPMDVGSGPSGCSSMGLQWNQLQTKLITLLCCAVQVNTEAVTTPSALCTAARLVSSVTLCKFPLP